MPEIELKPWIPTKIIVSYTKLGYFQQSYWQCSHSLFGVSYFQNIMILINCNTTKMQNKVDDIFRGQGVYDELFQN